MGNQVPSFGFYGWSPLGFVDLQPFVKSGQHNVLLGSQALAVHDPIDSTLQGGIDSKFYLLAFLRHTITLGPSPPKDLDTVGPTDHTNNVANTKTLTHQSTLVQMHVYLPRPLRKAAKTAAAEFDTTISQICADGLVLRLKQLRGKSSEFVEGTR